MEDTQIIALYLSRQEAAIGETAKKYGGYINRIAYNILRCREDTEEIAADTYLAAWNAIPPEIPRVLKHFLSRIARNLAFDRLDWRQAEKRNGQLVALTAELEQCIPDTRQELQMESRQIRALLEAFLRELPKQSRILFLRRYLYGDSIREIAQRYGLGESKVKMQLLRTRKRLYTFLEQEGMAL